MEACSKNWCLTARIKSRGTPSVGGGGDESGSVTAIGARLWAGEPSKHDLVRKPVMVVAGTVNIIIFISLKFDRNS